MTQVAMSNSPPTSPAGGPVVVSPPRSPNALNLESVNQQQSKGNGKGANGYVNRTPRKNSEEPHTPTKIALAASVGSPQVLKEGTAENQAWTASLQTPPNFYTDPYTRAWCSPEVVSPDLTSSEQWGSSIIPPWPQTGAIPSVFQGLDVQVENGSSLQVGLRPEAAEFNPDQVLDTQDSPWNDKSVGLRPDAAEFVPPNGAMNGTDDAGGVPRVDGLDPRKALLTLCGAWGALAGEKANEKGAIKVWDDDGPRMTKAALLKMWAFMKENDELEPPEGLGFRTKKRKRR